MLAIPIVMIFLIVITPFSLGITSPFDLCGMVGAGSRATSLSFICRGVFYEDRIPTGLWQSKLPLLGQVDGRSPHFVLEPQTMNYLIDDQPLASITLAYDYAPNTDERHMKYPPYDARSRRRNHSCGGFFGLAGTNRRR